jgi:hypothetical protein
MSSWLDTLHKILKDKTRRKIILLLNEKSSLSYTDLKSKLEITNNGLLNFHLKVLDDLLAKDAAGQYFLTEKGKLAAKLLGESYEQDGALQAKRKGWHRFWVMAIILNVFGVVVILSLNVLGYLDFIKTVLAIFGFSFSMVFLFFFYRMIRPVPNSQTLKGQTRTVRDIFVSGRQLQEIFEEVHHWINQEQITIELERDGMIRGRLGTPSGLGLTAAKYFEVSFKPESNGVLVHTEGWISAFDVSEKSFSKTALAVGGVPRKKGWQVMEHLWQRLNILSR